MTRRSISPPNLQYVKKGDLIRSEAWNSFVDAAKTVHDLANKTWPVERLDEIQGRNTSGDTIARYSVFTTKKTGDAFYLGQPTAEFKQYETTDSVLLTNDTTTLINNASMRATLIGSHRPYRVLYTGTAPTTGDTVGPVESSYAVSKEGTGLVVLTEPDTTNSLIWVTAVGSRGSALLIGKIPGPGTIGPGSTGDVHIYEQTGVAMPTAIAGPVVVNILNITGEDLYPGPYHYVEYIKHFNKPICFPAELEVCFQPELASTDLTS